VPAIHSQPEGEAVRKIATVLALGTLVLSGAAPAAAAPRAASGFGDVVGVARITSPTTAEVQVRYRCSGQDLPVNLWVAVKQGDRLVETADHTGTSSRNADAYAQSHRELDLLRCDDKTHVARFTVDQLEAPAPFGGFGTLRKGAKTYVQFCLTPRSATSEADVISSMEFVQAV
jgi:hypothetical protein